MRLITNLYLFQKYEIAETALLVYPWSRDFVISKEYQWF